MKDLKRALKVSLVLMVICGLIYPLLLTGVGQTLFSHKANGSMIEVNGKVVGSELIGQKFEDDRFFHGRVSAVDYNTTKGQKDKKDVNSGGSNLAVSNEELKKRVEKDIEEFLKKNPTVKKDNLPQDLFTSSASGLDPDISVESAKIQVERIAKVTGIKKDDIETIIKNNTQGKDAGIVGEERVNVLKMNLEIAKLIKVI
ncbi:K+-transporting ATPase ATPase C chain [Clostridium cavendishii DSM 21758]|uniref:Potassium-transporting ATPase KdpC subunit n=1 Tax=Clostridium cavendishii DSM 21758 TaxID=1121302 RepID=A0A1M6QST3_9CLOT|nr:potassium-transporting ATPase subunit KdpC [Clostridium cavendishii]SHK23379.1 K+-transporting ATPase ATPase C chain [Clostridium cavendishii DSM 21758]